MNAHTSIDIVARCFDAAAVNAIANHPAVLPGLSLGLDSDRRHGPDREPPQPLLHRRAWRRDPRLVRPRHLRRARFHPSRGQGGMGARGLPSHPRQGVREHKAQLVWAQTPVENRACRLFNRSSASNHAASRKRSSCPARLRDWWRFSRWRHHAPSSSSRRRSRHRRRHDAITGSKAAKAQKQAADQQVAEYRRQYDTSRADLAPWRETGASALSKLAGMYGVGPTVHGGNRRAQRRATAPMAASSPRRAINSGSIRATRRSSVRPQRAGFSAPARR
jgi:hypothetical protein